MSQPESEQPRNPLGQWGPQPHRDGVDLDSEDLDEDAGYDQESSVEWEDLNWHLDQFAEMFTQSGYEDLERAADDALDILEERQPILSSMPALRRIAEAEQTLIEAIDGVIEARRLLEEEPIIFDETRRVRDYEDAIETFNHAVIDRNALTE